MGGYPYNKDRNIDQRDNDENVEFKPVDTTFFRGDEGDSIENDLRKDLNLDTVSTPQIGGIKLRWHQPEKTSRRLSAHQSR